MTDEKMKIRMWIKKMCIYYKDVLPKRLQKRIVFHISEY